MLSLLHAMLHRKHELVSEGKTSMPAEEIAIYETAYDRILNQELEKYPDKKAQRKMNRNISKPLGAYEITRKII